MAESLDKKLVSTCINMIKKSIINWDQKQKF
jgi:hypothetical protein